MTIALDAPPVDEKRSLPAVMRRRLAPIEERLDRNTALAFGIVTVVAGLLRFVGLGKPLSKIFECWQDNSARTAAAFGRPCRPVCLTSPAESHQSKPSDYVARHGRIAHGVPGADLLLARLRSGPART